jgi:hypothetical protein
MRKPSAFRYSMSRTRGPRDVISLVIPRVGDNKYTATSSRMVSVKYGRETECLLMFL